MHAPFHRTARVVRALVTVIADHLLACHAHAIDAQVRPGARIAVVARAGVRGMHALACVALVIGALVSVVAVDPLARVDEHLNLVGVGEEGQVRIGFRVRYFRLEVGLMQFGRVGNRFVFDRAVHAAGAVAETGFAQAIARIRGSDVRGSGFRLTGASGAHRQCEHDCAQDSSGCQASLRCPHVSPSPPFLTNRLLRPPICPHLRPVLSPASSM